MGTITIYQCKFLFTSTMFFLFPSLFYGQGILDGYFSPTKETDIIMSFTTKNFNSFYQGKERQSPVPIHESIDEQIANLYVSYAISEKMTLVVNVPFIRNSSGLNQPDPAHGAVEVSGLQDIGVFAKLRFMKKETKAGTLSLGGAIGGVMPASNYEPAGLISLGNGATTIDALALLRYDSPAGFFADIQGGFSSRFGRVPSAAIFSGKFGYATQNYYATIYLNQQTSLSGSDITGISMEELQRLPETKVNYLIAGINGYILLTEKWGITMNAGVLFDGRNIGRFSFLTFGVGYKLRGS